MPNRMFSLSDEIFEKLKQEDNASGLVNRLLVNHYELIQSPKDKLEETKINIERLNQEAITLSNRVIEMEKKKEQIVNERLQEEQKKEASPEVKQRIRALHKEVFLTYDIDKSKLDELLEEYYLMSESSRIKNIIEFMQYKQINKIVKRGSES